MSKQLYMKPEVLQHEQIAFETGLSSCVKIGIVDGSNPPDRVCLRPDGTWVDID
ncbi:hypothetical protein [Paenibacillus puerhi]|uniref:hypothetical protein n=1 Tax=Paenibacillus puerhi TaxID=2692622 RepID=UPI00135726E4|nr:hypothetical protein [Paenibacillus puerhi]